MSITDNFSSDLARFETRLAEHLRPKTEASDTLWQGMRYVVHNGGKRLRPLLVYATASTLKADAAHADAPAIALELIHNYSLVHDDLPAMDDDALRRGKPTCHIAFDEATAILVGDALQCLAFETLVDPVFDLSAEQRLKMIRCLATASGARGMAAGQMIDLAASDTAISLEALKNMHRLKTGALLKASVTLGAIAAGNASPEDYNALSQFSDNIGLAFQIQDDVLDVISTTEKLGKQQGSDQKLNKSTYVSLLSLETAQRDIDTLHRAALASLEPFGDRAEPLVKLAHALVRRDY